MQIDAISFTNYSSRSFDLLKLSFINSLRDLSRSNGNVMTRISCIAWTLFCMQLEAGTKNVFGNLFWKRKILARLFGIQAAFDMGTSNFVVDLEQKLRVEYGQILTQEELYWFKKSRAKWFIDGERNTGIFYFSTLLKRKKRNILMLRDSAGNWILDPEALKSLVRIFFICLCDLWALWYRKLAFPFLITFSLA